VTDTLALDVPVELGLELVPIVRPYLSDAEWEALDDVINEGDGIGLGVPAVDLESPDAGSIIDCGILITLDRLAVFALERQELDIDLDLVTWNLLLVSGRMDLAEPCSPWEPT